MEPIITIIVEYGEVMLAEGGVKQSSKGHFYRMKIIEVVKKTVESDGEPSHAS